MTGAGGSPSIRGLFNREAVLKILAGFLVSGVLIYLLATAVGWRETAARLAAADPVWLGAACASTMVCLAAWGKAWQVVLSVTGIDVPYRRLVVTYFAATFANYVTPLGQAGGEPFIAYVLSRDTAANYEESLASVVTADLLNLLPFFNFAAVGMGFLLVRTSLTDAAQDLAVALAVLAVGIPAMVVAGWHYRTGVERAVLRVAAPVVARTDRFSTEGIRTRIERFYGSVEVIASEPRQLAYALCFSYVGWVFFALPLYLSGVAVGAEVGLLLVLFIVPASTIAGMVPTPGGLAAVEGALVGLIVAVTALGRFDAAAITALYRLSSYWFALAIGGVAALWVVWRA